MKKERGAIEVVQIVTWGIGLITVIFTSAFAATRTVENDIKSSKESSYKKDIENENRITKLETNYQNIDKKLENLDTKIETLIKYSKTK